MGVIELIRVSRSISFANDQFEIAIVLQSPVGGLFGSTLSGLHLMFFCILHRAA